MYNAMNILPPNEQKDFIQYKKNILGCYATTINCNALHATL